MKETKFKQTEVGMIPCDWEVKKLGDIAQYRRGSFPQPYGLPKWYDGKGAMPFVQVADVSTDSFCLNSETKQQISTLAQPMSVFVPKNSVLVTLQGSIGKVAITQYDSYVDRTLAIFKAYNLPMSSIYFSYQLSKKFAIEREKAPGGIIKTITKEAFSDFCLPLPPTIEEQQRIANALSDVDTLIANLEKLIAKKKNIKQGTMQELLTGKKRLPGFAKSNYTKMTELGEIPEDWEVKILNELINDISDGPFGSNLKTEHYTTEGEVRIIQLSNVGEDGWDNENVKYTTFTHAKEIQRCIVPYGSIVIAKMMPAGRAILCPNQEKMYILGSDCVRISPNNLLDSLFFMYFSKTSFYLNQIKENTQGSTRARTSVSKLKRIEIALPPKKEQISIAKILSDMDNEIDFLNTKLEKYRNLKTAMMQQLLTGKIRLVK